MKSGVSELCLPISTIEDKMIKLLKSMNYSQKTINDYSNAIRHISELQNNYNPGMYSESAGNLWLAEMQQRNISLRYFQHCRCIVLRLNDVLTDNAYVKNHTFHSYTVPPEFEDVFHGYIGYLKSKRLKESTIRNKLHYASIFLVNLSLLGCQSTEDITGEIITKASIMSNAHNYPSAIRGILGFMLETEIIHCDYSFLIRKAKKKQPIPTVYSKNEIKLIEQYPDPSTPMGKRDRSMILLATRNGLRAGNIVGLKLSEIDFDNDVMHLEPVKTGDAINPVLLPDVKAALLDYIENGRPDVDSDFVFLTTVPPYTQMHRGDVRHITYKAICETGIEVNGRKCGPHAMRSSLNSAGVNNGISYEEMRMINGHKDPNAIKHYARLHDTKLRECALEVNPPTGFFARFLMGKEALPVL